jgi:hypothetical protein
MPACVSQLPSFTQEKREIARTMLLPLGRTPATDAVMRKEPVHSRNSALKTLAKHGIAYPRFGPIRCGRLAVPIGETLRLQHSSDCLWE